MTSYGDQSATMSLRTDGIDLTKLAAATTARATLGAQKTERHRFWVSGQRYMQSNHREIMELSFGAARIVNHLSFKVSRFPLNLRAEYLDRNGDWQRFTYATTNHRKGPRRTIRRQPVGLSISQSVPARVNSAQRRGHPQHFGKSHWLSESWRVTPVRTRKIRFIITRNDMGDPPRNHRGQRVPYSVALKDLSIGYRVTTRGDIPRTPDQPWWASSKDIVGSQTVYSTYEQPAGQAIDGDLSTYWRSEPQPFPFAVVNYYLDLRDADGVPPVIDRFWVDPVTTGVHCNVYYSDAEPEGSFEGLSEAIPAQVKDEVGNPIPVRDAATQRALAINLGPATQTGIEVSNTYLRLRYDQPWWVGIDADTLTDPTDTTPRPLVSVGTTQIVQQGSTLRVISQTGESADIVLDPTLFPLGAHFRLVVAYYPDDLATKRPPYFRITYLLEGYDEPITSEIAVAPLPDISSPVRIGLHPDPENLDIAAVSVRGLVIKSEALTPETEDWFIDEGEAFVADVENVHEDRGTAQNARVRMHPMFYSATNLFGVVGGSGNRFAEMEWTPVSRDYALKQGYMHVPPTKAAYWKFEMTNLLPQVYENFLTINRDVLVFPPDVVAAYEKVAGQRDNRQAPSGVTTLSNSAPNVSYSDALAAAALANEAPSDASKALVVKDPLRAQQVAETGWIWTYQPWHIGTRAPQFIGTRQHRYESLRVDHQTKVAFFAAIREITPYRVDYTFDDDTPEYVEHLLDTTFLDLTQTDSVEHFEGGVRATANHAEVTSKSMLSYRKVRGVQFASQETDSVQVFPDPDFLASDLGLWHAYGDANLDLLGPNDVLVSRGWFLYTYGDLEKKYFSYGEMDGVLYSQLEGNNLASGAAEGGITSQTYTPSGAGKILAAVQISAGEIMEGPVVVDIVSAYDDRVVASDTKWLRIGETATIRVGYAPGTLTQFRTYADVETMVSSPTTYGELEAFRYYELETEQGIQSDLYVRVRQRGQSDDAFHVHRIALYDSPVAWFFSNDDGDTWWQALDVRNNPSGVLIFPESFTPEVPGTGRTLRWKARLYRENAVINALHIRPWYGTRAKTVEPTHGLDALGPNQSLLDIFPATHQHPMWLDRFNPIEHVYVEPVPVKPFWRNLAINPSGEGDDPASWEASGGTFAFVDPSEVVV